MLLSRVITSTFVIGIFIGVLALDELMSPWYPLWIILAALVLGWTSLEIVGLLNRTSARPSGNVVFGGTLAIVVSSWIPHVLDSLNQAGDLNVSHDPLAPALWMAWPLWTFVAVVMFSFIAQSVQFVRPGQTMATIAGTVLAVAYVGLLGTFFIQLRWLGGPREGVLAVVTTIAIAKGSDIGAYTCGRIFGRHKLWPRLSPNKTIEGALGGMLFAILAAQLVMALSARFLGHRPLGAAATIGFGLAVGVVAQLGDLMESMIKRDCSQKDASDTLPGFGGVLDLIDSLLFCGPVAFGYWLLFSS